MKVTKSALALQIMKSEVAASAGGAKAAVVVSSLSLALV
jgi:hypothetical protein